MRDPLSWLRFAVRLLLPALLLLAPASAQASSWHRADSANFRIHGERTPDELAATARLLEAFRLLVADLTGTDPAQPAARLDIFLVRSAEQASPWQPLRAGVAGFYRADPGRISAVVIDRPPRGPFDVDPREVLLHEVTHHLLLASRPADPAWFVEGFADYLSTARFEGNQVQLGHAGANRLAWLQRAAWLPLQQVLAFDPDRAPPADVARLYAQGWLLVHWLHQDSARLERLQAYLRACAAGADPVEAFRQHVAADLESVETDLRAYLASGLPNTSRPATVPDRLASVPVSPLPASAGSLLMRLVALEHGLLPPDRARVLAEVRRHARRAGAEDPLALQLLARAELMLGDPRHAARLADALSEAVPNDPDRWRLLAEAALAVPDGAPAARRDTARRAFARVLLADPRDWRAMHALARLDRPDGPDRLALLLAANRLAPQVRTIALDAAVALARAGQLPAAADLLGAVAHAPAGGAAGALARRMLEHADRGDAAAFLWEVRSVQAAATMASSQGRLPAQLR